MSKTLHDLLPFIPAEIADQAGLTTNKNPNANMKTNNHETKLDITTKQFVHHAVASIELEKARTLIKAAMGISNDRAVKGVLSIALEKINETAGELEDAKNYLLQTVREERGKAESQMAPAIRETKAL